MNEWRATEVWDTVVWLYGQVHSTSRLLQVSSVSLDRLVTQIKREFWISGIPKQQKTFPCSWLAWKIVGDKLSRLLSYSAPSSLLSMIDRWSRSWNNFSVRGIFGFSLSKFLSWRWERHKSARRRRRQNNNKRHSQFSNDEKRSQLKWHSCCLGNRNWLKSDTQRGRSRSTSQASIASNHVPATSLIGE